MKRWFVAAGVGLGIMGAAFAITWWFLSSPYWSLYQIGKGIHERDPDRVLAYLDVGNILENMVKHEAARSGQLNKGTNALAMALGGAIVRAMTPQFKGLLARAIADPKRKNIDSPWALVFAASVEILGNSARVELKEDEHRRLRCIMQKRQGQWIVVEVNPQDLEKLTVHRQE